MRPRLEIFLHLISLRKFTEMKEESRHSTRGISVILINFPSSLDSALLRQAVYATLRLGIYFNLTDHIKNNVNNG